MDSEDSLGTQQLKINNLSFMTGGGWERPQSTCNDAKLMSYGHVLATKFKQRAWNEFAISFTLPFTGFSKQFDRSCKYLWDAVGNLGQFWSLDLYQPQLSYEPMGSVGICPTFVATVLSERIQTYQVHCANYDPVSWIMIILMHMQNICIKLSSQTYSRSFIHKPHQKRTYNILSCI